jgi:CII-binding regulator of phage lambda lysogenization HflD
VDLFREQYQVLMSYFESTATHVTSELRKVEVNLTQLPRTMDQPGSELNELMNRLENLKNACQ